MKYLIDEHAKPTAELLKNIADYYKDYLLTDMLKCWEKVTIDNEYGGYITSFDEHWRCTGTDKGAWGQSRHVYIFSKAYEVLGKDSKWLEYARTGEEFVKNKMYDNVGRINYLTDRVGNVKEGTISVFSDEFAVSGTAEYISASQSDKYLPFLNTLYDTLERNLTNPDFADLTPYPYIKGLTHHSVYMIGANSAFTARKVLGKRADKLIDFCVDKVMNVSYDAVSGLILERKNNDGSYYMGELDRSVNVGHTYESMWFMLDVALERKDRDMLRKICSIVDRTDEKVKSYGKEMMFSFVIGDEDQNIKTWKYETNFLPFDNVSWSYSEAMSLFAKLYMASGQRKYFEKFLRLHNLAENYFKDEDNGDWYHALDENFKVKANFKGSLVKTAYHMPRAFMNIIEAFGK